MTNIRERIKAWLRDTPANASQLLRSSQLLRDADEEIERLREEYETSESWWRDMRAAGKRLGILWGDGAPQCLARIVAEVEKLREENEHLQSQLARGVAHARERVGLVEDVETMRGLLVTACDAWECGSRPRDIDGIPLPDCRSAWLPQTWYDAARQACGGDEGGDKNHVQ